MAAANDYPATWQEYSFTNELNGITLSFRFPVDAENGTMLMDYNGAFTLLMVP